MGGFDPIKLCCGHRFSEHRGPQCPDDKVMCCLCFDRFGVADLATDLDGATIDVCVGCFADEAMAMERKMAEAGEVSSSPTTTDDEAKAWVCEECGADWNPFPDRPNQCRRCGNRTRLENAPIGPSHSDASEPVASRTYWPETT